MEVKHRDLRKFVDRAYETGVSLYIHGTTGIGKSYTVEERAKAIAAKLGKKYTDWNRISDTDKSKFVFGDKAAGIPAEVVRAQHFIFVDMRISQMDPSDLKGLPDISADETRFTVWKPNMEFWVLSRPETTGILFLDEMNLAVPAVQASAYQLIRDRCVGTLAISKGVAVMGAGNTSKDRANVFEMAAPLKNRFAHVTLLRPSADEWADEFAFEKGVDFRIISFLKFRPGLLMADEKLIQDMQTLAFPTPRTWEMASTLIKDITSPVDAARFAQSCIGQAAATEFKAHLLMHTTLDVEAIIADPRKLAAVDLQGKWVLISAVADMYRSDKKKFPKVISLCKALNVADKDFAISCLRLAKAAAPDTFQISCASNPEAAKLILQYSKYLSPNLG